MDSNRLRSYPFPQLTTWLACMVKSQNLNSGSVDLSFLAPSLSFGGHANGRLKNMAIIGPRFSRVVCIYSTLYCKTM